MINKFKKSNISTKNNKTTPNKNKNNKTNPTKNNKTNPNKNKNNKTTSNKNKNNKTTSNKNKNNKTTSNKNKKSKINVEHISSKPDEFGFLVDIPNELQSLKKNYKVKCKKIKNKKEYKEPKIKKKLFGYVLPQLNKSLYVPKQQDYNCYN